MNDKMERHIKANGYTSRGGNFFIFPFLPPFSIWSTFKGENLLPWEQILTFNSRPYVKGSIVRGSNQGKTIVVPLSKIGGKQGTVSITSTDALSLKNTLEMVSRGLMGKTLEEGVR